MLFLTICPLPPDTSSPTARNAKPAALGPPRERALAALRLFEERALPAVLRRLRQWKGLDGERREDFVDELRQELALDALLHPAEILSLDRPGRHQRWLRLAQSRHYRATQRAAGPRTLRCSPPLDSLPQPMHASRDAGPPITLTTAQRLRAVARAAVFLRNGRLNVSATAAALDLQPRTFRRRWAKLVAELGFGRRYVTFWRRRLTEALIQHAVNLLAERGALRLCRAEHSPRRRPRVGSIAASRRRLRRIQSALSSHPPCPELRPALTCIRARRPDPRQMLDAARRIIEVTSPAIELWRFEAAIAARDLDAAAAAWRAARAATHPPRIPLILALARWCEARRGPATAARVLRWFSQREDDARIAQSLVACDGDRGQRA